MLSLYEILKASKTGIAPDMWTALAGMNWGGKDSGAEVKELTGIPPLSIRSNGTMLLDYLISGNMYQASGVSPATPIQPSECGDLSENLYDTSNPNIYKGYYNTTTNSLTGNPNNAFIYIPLVQGRKYYVYGCRRYNTSASIRWVTTSSTPFNNVSCIRTGTFAQTDIFTITAEANENYLALFLCGDSDYSTYGTVEDAIATNGANLVIDNGYKIPILSNSTTTPVYLGEVQSTRRIYKYEFTGQEEWKSLTADPSKHYLAEISPDYMRMENIITYICSHYSAFPQTSSATSVPNLQMSMTYSTTSQRLYIADANYTTNADFKTYLAQQYAAGTPVCVWYVLATPQTAVVNEPLRKIGDYADTLSYEQAGVQIPTLHGNTVIDVDTTLKPSQMYIKYQE